MWFSVLDFLCPVITYSNPIYDIERLTHYGSLSAFWQDSARFKIDKNQNYNVMNHLINNS